MTAGRNRAACCALATALAMVGAGCAGTSRLTGGHRDSGQIAVVKRWAEALQAGDVRAAAELFGRPSVFSNPPLRLKIHSLGEAEAANATLTCGATFLSAVRQGRYVNVLFRLTNRPGEGGGPNSCGSGAGQTARTDFLIAHGRILQWVRAPSEPGDPGVPTTPSSPGAGSGIV